MGGVCTYRTMSGTKSGALRSLAVSLSLSVIAITLSACQAPATLATATPKTQLHPPASSATSTNALAFLNRSDQQLVGLGDHDLTAALGEPSHIRHDEPATIWQYAGNECVLDFYLYKADAGLQVAYVEARDRKAQSEGTQTCVHSLLQPNEAAVQKIPEQKTADAVN